MKKACIRPYIWALFLAIVIAVPLQAQEEAGWGFSGSLQGSSNSSDVVLKADPAVDYNFNPHFRTYAGLPVYFVNPSSTISTTVPSATGFMDGIGNAYLGMRFAADNPAVNFASNVVTTAPTGDKDKGFSTGRVTVDWTNSFSHRFSSVTPFGSIGLANTVSDTTFFVRPFSSLGFVTHFDGGASLNISRVEIGGSAYGVRGAGQQTIISKLVNRKSTAIPTAVSSAASNSHGKGKGKTQVFQTASETIGSSDLANDHGFSGWLGLEPRPGVDFQVGYTRSVDYDLNTVFFGAGFHFGK